MGALIGSKRIGSKRTINNININSMLMCVHVCVCVYVCFIRDAPTGNYHSAWRCSGILKKGLRRVCVLILAPLPSFTHHSLLMLLLLLLLLSTIVVVVSRRPCGESDLCYDFSKVEKVRLHGKSENRYTYTSYSYIYIELYTWYIFACDSTAKLSYIVAL